ncbi:hypothetical protein GP486_004658 [Trichoglossum hirsutum]|uniref:Uncharacterized protein n=1 Tax=Trichoglossum hirsutum TaxID=265104 RepID=A0A9P8LAQ0_9PEZI|nr:hypothetical protein GP486_004658 [Trichoglossum hirsutum]
MSAFHCSFPVIGDCTARKIVMEATHSRYSMLNEETQPGATGEETPPDVIPTVDRDDEEVKRRGAVKGLCWEANEGRELIFKVFNGPALMVRKLLWEQNTSRAIQAKTEMDGEYSSTQTQQPDNRLQFSRPITATFLNSHCSPAATVG